MRYPFLFLLLSVFSGFPQLVAQSADYEAEIGDRLYAFEMARLQQLHERVLAFVYPELFTLIPREMLLEQMRMSEAPRVEVTKLTDFSIDRISEPLELGGNTYVRLTYAYRLPDEVSASPQLHRVAHGAADEPATNSRSLLAIRTDRDLQWYFLETANGQEAMLSALLPAAVISLK